MEALLALMAVAVRMRKILLYAIGGFGVTVASYGFMQWAQYLFSPPEGAGWTPLLPVELFGILTAWGRLVDALSNLFLPYLADRGLPFLGRRKGFIIVGGLGNGLSAFFLFALPALSPPSAFRLPAVFLLFGLFFLFFTMSTAPYLALLSEIPSSPTERVRYALAYAFFNFLGVLFVFAIGGRLIGQQAFVLLGILFAISVALPLLVAGMSAGEPPNPSPISSPLIPLLREAFSLSAFRIFLLTTTLSWAGLVVLLSLLPYITTVWWELPERAFEWIGFTVIGSAIASLPFSYRFVRKFGKKKMYLIGLFSLSFAALLLAFLNMPLRSHLYVLAICIFILLGFTISLMVGIPNAILADLAEKEAMEGKGKSAMLFGLTGVFSKTAQGITIFLSTQVLKTFGFSPQHSLGLTLGILGSAFLLLLSTVNFLRYPEAK